MPKIIDYRNQIVDGYTITERANSIKQGEINWKGVNKETKEEIVYSAKEIKEILGSKIKSKTKKREDKREDKKEYTAWSDMIQRCYNSKKENYRWYGLKGIEVCKEWRDDYNNFLKDVGRAPSPTHTLDRINTLKNYEPGNVEWKTHQENCQHQTQTVLTEPDVLKIKHYLSLGLTVKEISKLLDFKRHLIADVKSGRHWSNIN